MKYLIIPLVLLHSTLSAQWTQIPGIPGNRTVSALLAEGDTLYAGADSLFYIGTAGGTNWSSANSPVPPPDAISDLLYNDGVVLAGTFNHGVFKSTNGGASWQAFSSGLTGLGAASIGDLRLRRDSLVVGTLGAGVFATPLDLTHGWSPLGDSLAEYQGENVFKLFVAGNTILAGGGANGYMFRYTDAQPWWNPIDINSPRLVGQYVTGMASDGTTVLAGTNAGIYRSTDEGLSWVRSDLALPGGTIQTILLFHGPEVFAAMTTPFSFHLYVSHDTAATWEPLGEFALPNMLDAVIIGDTMFIGGEGGLWEAPLSQLVTPVDDGGELPRGFTLRQNYPNPFNPATSIAYSLPVTTGVSLKVYDALGRVTAVLYEGVQNAGEHEVRFDGSQLGSGVFYCRLSAGGFTRTRPMLLLK